MVRAPGAVQADHKAVSMAPIVFALFAKPCWCQWGHGEVRRASLGCVGARSSGLPGLLGVVRWRFPQGALFLWITLALLWNPGARGWGVWEGQGAKLNLIFSLQGQECLGDHNESPQPSHWHLVASRAEQCIGSLLFTVAKSLAVTLSARFRPSKVSPWP